MKPLKLRYGGSWRTKADERHRKKPAWRKIRDETLERGDYTCVYCDYRNENKSENAIQVNHIDGNPKNEADDNLEVVCSDCHKILHSGFWALEQGILEIYAESNYDQNNIVRMTRDLRANGRKDEEIKELLGLKRQVPWEEDLDYLSSLFGFISLRPFKKMPRILLSEEEQRRRLEDQAK